MNESKPERHDEDALSDLLKQGRRREQPSDAAKRAAYAALQDDWRSVVERRSRRRRIGLVGVAASFALVAAILWSPLDRVNDGGRSLTEVFGTVELATTGDIYRNGNRVAGANTLLRAGDRFATGTNTRAALRPADGGSLRLDANTALVALAPNQLRLEYGAVYIDSLGSKTGNLTILTSLGSVRHIGTRYAVRLEDDSLTISVRGGRVQITRSDRTWEKRAGERLTLTETDESTEAIATFGRDWDWVVQAAPPRSLEAPQSAHDLVVWIARESGYEIAYESELAERQAQTLVSGLGNEVGPQQALEALGYAIDLQFEVDGGTLSISER